MLKLKLQYFLSTWCEDPTHWKRPWCREWLKVREGDDRGWDGWVGHEFLQTPGDGEGQGSLPAAVHRVTKSQTWLNNKKRGGDSTGRAKSSGAGQSQRSARAGLVTVFTLVSRTWGGEWGTDSCPPQLRQRASDALMWVLSSYMGVAFSTCILRRENIQTITHWTMVVDAWSLRSVTASVMVSCTTHTCVLEAPSGNSASPLLCHVLSDVSPEHATGLSLRFSSVTWGYGHLAYILLAKIK